MQTRAKSSYKVPAAANSARILMLLARHERGLRMIEVARELKMNVSTCHNVLRTLCDEGLLSYDEDWKSYRIGLALIIAISNVIERGDQMSLIRPILQGLSDRLRMTAILGEVIERRAIRMLLSTAPTGGLSLHPPGLEAVPLLSGSMGRIAAAWSGMGEAELRERFDEAEHTPSLDFTTFVRETKEAYDRGWAVDEGTWQRGIWGIAAPIPAASGKTRRILCLATASERLAPEQVPDVVEDLIATAKVIAVGEQGA